jgi:hypothetical protein
MDIHKPKPWHGLREFLKEYVIIVVGVLTALGAEQAVVTVHEHKIANEARESVRAEVRENLWWLERREKTQPCRRQQMAELGDVLDNARHGRPYPVPRELQRVYHAKLTSLRWEANAQAGRASLFTRQEQQSLGNMYYTTEQYGRAQDVEEEVWSKLDAIDGLDRLTPQEIDQFATLLAQARFQSGQVDLNIMRAHQWALALGLKGENPNVLEVPVSSVMTVTCPSISAIPVGTRGGVVH